jgi:hypothetical protein
MAVEKERRLFICVFANGREYTALALAPPEKEGQTLRKDFEAL